GMGFTFPDSASNFLFASHPDYDASMIFEELKKRHIFVRYWNKPRINQHLRITIGTSEEMKTLYTALEEILRSSK
ncbi:MAG: histidinol-phosphate transaminase, partial [Oscillospiraceae bacterium]|nr:histidinol-phosphate transaminase [Oscillospiraceae bacterium]